MQRNIRTVLAAALTTALSLSALPAEAQIFRAGPFGGVQIRAPFTAVDVGPFGRTRVRAPFAAVDAPGPAIYPPGVAIPAGRRGVIVAPGIPLPPLPTPFAARVSVRSPGVQLESGVYETPSQAPPSIGSADTSPAMPNLSAQEILARLEVAGQTLRTALEANPNGEPWLDFLRPSDLAGLAQQGDETTLRQLFGRYDGVGPNPDLAWLRNLAGFQTTRDLIATWLGQTNPTASPAAPARSPTANEPTPAPQPREAAPPIGEGELPPAEAIPTPQPQPTGGRFDA